MELHPIFDENSQISKNLWYAVSAVGESPLMRVGHTIVHKRTSQESKGKFFIIGGANPSNSFNDAYILDMDILSWDKFDEDNENFSKGRYEHSCLLLDNSIFIFAGSNEDGSLNDILKFDTENNKIEKIANTSPNVPSPRTIHVGANIKNQLLVFGGGESGKKSVEDQKIYIYNATLNKWISLNGKGHNPEPRQGHVMIAHNDYDLYIHGGVNEDVLYDDLWHFNLKGMIWTKIDGKKPAPEARAAHGGISVNNNLYIFGGIDQTGLALDDLWKYDITESQWTMIEINGYKPPNRLDFAYCKATFRVKQNDDIEEAKCDDQNFLVIHGGMDTEGNFFDDIFLISLE
ncbi:rab9 effector with kelch motifs-like isoform X1 [Brachionus plicatilis]|uniref:Rab9 effector protein with kelch motifs n=1 Tax=Brachionus plicatilis TaxID=10195 RepID=A0A3M7SVV3_BRAPC|nr:rab9 effector with kelch motifs-like isoform X1 [Brachionus plicatilis]